MKSVPWILLALSLLVNAVLLGRRPEPEPPKAPSPARPAPARVEPAELEPPAAAAAAPAPVRTEKSTGLISPPPAARTASVRDPEVLGILEAQDDFGALWKELDRVFRARGKMDEALYDRTVTGALEEYLGLPTSSRAAFSAALRAAAAEVAAARLERDAAKGGLPPKSEPVLYQQQKEAVELRCQQRIQRAVDGVKAHLDLRQPRHAELGHNLEKVLRNLVPR